MMTDREKLIRWRDALESGLFKPAKHLLRSNMATADGDRIVCFCAIGVLLELDDPDGWDGAGGHRGCPMPHESSRVEGVPRPVMMEVADANDQPGGCAHENAAKKLREIIEALD